MKKVFKISTGTIGMTLLLFSCAGNGEKVIAGTPSAATTTVAQEAVTPAAPVLSNVLNLEGNDQMQYNQTEFKVAAGQSLTLILKHTGKLDKNAMGHNFVLLKPGTDISAFATKALEAKDTGYIPKSESASIIAHTKLLGGGESDTITFSVEQKGTYDFVCSFPGHVSMMKGKLIVE